MLNLELKKLIYVSNILKSSNAARARQVFESEKAFQKILNKNFVAITADSYLLTRIFKKESNFFRKILFHFLFIIRVFFYSRKTIIYSRNLSILLLAKILGFTIIWEAHDLPFGKNELIIQKLGNKFRIVTNTLSLKNKLIELFNFSNSNILVAHNGVNIENYNTSISLNINLIKNKFNLPLDKRIILHSGSIMKERGVSLFKDVLTSLPNWFFVQVGGGEKDIEVLKKELSSFNNVLFIPHQNVENLIQLQLSCDALFYMITKETSTYWCCSPMKIFEYLAAGKPIVASNIGSLSEIINDDVAFLYNPEDTESLKCALSKLNNENECLQLSQNAVNLARQNYTWDLRAENILKFLEIKI